MDPQRTQVVATIQAIQQQIAQIVRVDAALAARLRQGEASTLARTVDRACQQVGLSGDQYRSALAHDPDLQQLEQKAISEALGGSTDPGPYDAISRESPNAREGDMSKPRDDGPESHDAQRPQMPGPHSR